LDQRPPLNGYSNLSFNISYFGLNNGLELRLGGTNLLDDDIFEPSAGPDVIGGAVNIPYDLPQAGKSLQLSLVKEF
jgi:hypothetical protein